MERSRTALIIGGGIVGVTSAYALARDGWHVRLVERQPAVAMGASLGNGRQLSYSYTNALGRLSLLPQIPGLLMGRNESFRLSFRYDLSFVRWAARLLTNSNNSAFRRNTMQTLALAEHSRQAMADLLARHQIEFSHHKAGKLALLRGKAEVRLAHESMLMKRNAGIEQELLTAKEACELEPALSQSDPTVTAALYSPNDEVGDCATFARELCNVIVSEYGVELIANADAKAISRAYNATCVTLASGEELRAEHVVVANGYCAGDLLAPLGYNLPIEPMKGYSFTAPIGNAPPRLSITDSMRRIVFTNIGDRILVAGIAEMGKLHGKVDRKRLEAMKVAAMISLPEAARYSECDDGWVGFRPITPNSQPIIRQLQQGISVNAGHGMLGWTLAMGSAERLAEIVGAG